MPPTAASGHLATRVGAVVLLYRYWPEIKPTLEALLAQTHPPVVTVVVDNDPAATGPGAIRRSFPEVTVIESPDNGGYAAGMNRGVRSIPLDELDAVLLLTHDCVLAPDAVERMADRLRRAPAVGAVGPLTGLRSDPDRVFSGGCAIDHRWETAIRAHPANMAGWDGRPPERCDWLGGHCLLFRTAAWQAVGPLDEEFFLYFEEVDHQLQLRRLGWEVECVPSARAWQEPGVIPQNLWSRNRLRFVARHAGARVARRRVATEVIEACRDARRGDRARASARLSGVARFLGRRWGPIPPPRSGAPPVARS